MLAAPPGPWRQRPRSAPQRARLSSSKPLIGCSFPWIQKFGGVLASSRWYSRVCFSSLALPLSLFANNADVSLTSLDKRLSRQVGRGEASPRRTVHSLPSGPSSRAALTERTNPLRTGNQGTPTPQMGVLGLWTEFEMRPAAPSVVTYETTLPPPTRTRRRTAARLGK